MSNYLQKYHLKKVQPVKNRPKNSYVDYIKMQQKAQKVGLVKPAVKRKIPPHRNYFQREQQRIPNTTHKTQKNIKLETNPLIEQFAVEQKRDVTPKARNMHRTHKSLNFKSGKDHSTGVKILNTIQGFLSNLMRNNEGCNCGQPCKWSAIFFRWVDVPLEIIKDHYVKLYTRWQSIMKPSELQSQSKSNDQSRRLTQYQKMHQECKKNYKQIIKDIDRTQSQCTTFQNIIFKEKAKNILMCYAIEDPKIGYIQGMNIILSGILYHTKDQIKSFAIFRNIILNMRNIYLNDFKECYTHISTIKQYLNEYVHDLYQIFQEINVDLNMVCLPWILSLLSSLVPLDYLHLIYDGFIRQKWMFIYKVSLAIFIYHKDSLMCLQQPCDILLILSPTNENKNDYDWQDIIGFGNSITL